MPTGVEKSFGLILPAGVKKQALGLTVPAGVEKQALLMVPAGVKNKLWSHSTRRSEEGSVCTQVASVSRVPVEVRIAASEHRIPAGLKTAASVPRVLA